MLAANTTAPLTYPPVPSTTSGLNSLIILRALTTLLKNSPTVLKFSNDNERLNP